jgi:type VI secretion system protein ImpA
MAIDINALTTPLSDEQPSGPDLSYDSERQEIESAFERSVSDGGTSGDDETDWRETIKLITAQAERTRDLWLPVYLMRAAAQSGNFEMVADGSELLARLLEDRWADVHPQLEEYGFTGRKTPCESLTRIAEFLGPFSRMPLLEHQRLGSYSGADFERFHDQGSSAESYGMFRALIEATSVEDLQAVVDRLDAIRAAIKRADQVMTANAEGDTSTNYQTTYEAMDKIRRAVASNLPVDDKADVAQDGDAGDSDGWSGSGDSTSHGGSGQGGPGFSGGINSRNDVIRALDAISAYYAKSEPASPVPFALRRAKEWISLDFLAVLEDIAPGGLDEAKKILNSGRNAVSAPENWRNSSSANSESSEGSVASPATDSGW